MVCGLGFRVTTRIENQMEENIIRVYGDYALQGPELLGIWCRRPFAVSYIISLRGI